MWLHVPALSRQRDVCGSHGEGSGADVLSPDEEPLVAPYAMPGGGGIAAAMSF